MSRATAGGRHWRTGALELLRGDHLASEDHLHGAAFAHLANEALRAAEAGDHADLNLRLPELRLVARVDHVERHRDLHAAAELQRATEQLSNELMLHT